MIKLHLARIMEEKKVNIAEIATKTGLHRNGASNLYHQKVEGIRFDTLEKLCIALDCKIEDLLEIVEKDSKKE
ncbi:helix-turn-helix domain-containing protein [Salipaludibacillus sp. CF4.18]|uniref:helix-turn-helix domain-containing protein n=1 Tax=Salipaludibacillus sp. CF4.18 TaxID=3373081 RepID=UPI003EE59A43